MKSRNKPRKEDDMTPWQLKQFAMREWKQVASAAEIEEYERWSKWLSAENRKAAKREWNYRKRFDGWCDTTLAHRDGEEGEHIDARWLKRLSVRPDYLERIFSLRPEHIHELLSDEAISAAVKNCTPRQKQSLHCFLSSKTKTSDAARVLGTSDRNILKLLATTRKNILQEIGAMK